MLDISITASKGSLYSTLGLKHLNLQTVDIYLG